VSRLEAGQDTSTLQLLREKERERALSGRTGKRKRDTERLEKREQKLIAKDLTGTLATS